MAPVYGTLWPDPHRVPDHPLTDGASVDVGGLTVTVHTIGAAESNADSFVAQAVDAVVRHLDRYVRTDLGPTG